MQIPTIESDVLLAREGDEAAFRRLVEASANTVCAIALAIVRNVQASEDVAQEVFLAAWSNLKKLRNPASFKSVNPEMAKLKRRQWMWATIGRAAGAAMGGAVLMAMAISMR